MNNYEILKEYEAHGEPLPTFEDYKMLQASFDYKHEDNMRLLEENKILKNKLLQAKPELKEWVEKNFKGV